MDLFNNGEHANRVVVPFSPGLAWIYLTMANMLTGLLFRLVQGQHVFGLTLGGLEALF